MKGSLLSGSTYVFLRSPPPTRCSEVTLLGWNITCLGDKRHFPQMLQVLPSVKVSHWVGRRVTASTTVVLSGCCPASHFQQMLLRNKGGEREAFLTSQLSFKVRQHTGLKLKSSFLDNVLLELSFKPKTNLNSAQ